MNLTIKKRKDRVKVKNVCKTKTKRYRHVKYKYSDEKFDFVLLKGRQHNLDYCCIATTAILWTLM